MRNMKHKIMGTVFAVIMAFGLITNLIWADQEVSLLERRPLAQKPELNLEFVISGNADTKIESYFLDQVAGRNTYLIWKSFVDKYIISKDDSNGYYSQNGHLFKMNYPLKESRVIKAAKKLDELLELLDEGNKVFYGIIPDKEQFANNNNHLKVNFEELVTIFNQALKNEDGNASYLDIYGLLTLDDFYTTDLHWRQDRLDPVVDAIYKAFQMKEEKPSYEEIGRASCRERVLRLA